MNSKCPVCNTDIQKIQRVSGSLERCSCQRCGDFEITVRLKMNLSSMLSGDNQKIAVLSDWIRSKHEARIIDTSGQYEIPRLDEKLVETILKQKPPNPAEQADNFVLWLGNSKHPLGELVWVQPCTHQSIMGAITPEGFELVLYHLMDEGILQGNKAKAMGAPGRAYVTLSFEGWQYYEELKLGTTDSRKAFMAMQYGEIKLDNIVEEIFKPAVKQTGFDLFKLPDRPKAGLIDDRIRVEIQTSRFLIADLTHENRGAYWEAGYAEGLGKPVIYTCEKKKFKRLKTHFDTNHHLTILWDSDNLKEAAEELKATIRATLPGEAKLTDE